MHKFWCVALAALGYAGAALADPVEGLWKTAPQDDGSYGFVMVAACANAICGVLVKGVNAQGETATEGGNMGRQILWDMIPAGEGRYDGGKVWSPDRDTTYASELILDGDLLHVRGCFLGICRDGGTWTRVK